MPGSRFFDTNILGYALAADDPRSGPAEAFVANGGPSHWLASARCPFMMP
jgi:predicted nucleic acid-binding protein